MLQTSVFLLYLQRKEGKASGKGKQARCLPRDEKKEGVGWKDSRKTVAPMPACYFLVCIPLAISNKSTKTKQKQNTQPFLN